MDCLHRRRQRYWLDWRVRIVSDGQCCTRSRGEGEKESTTDAPWLELPPGAALSRWLSRVDLPVWGSPEMGFNDVSITRRQDQLRGRARTHQGR